MSGIARPQSSKRKKNVVGITTRAPESNFSWLKYLMKACSDLLEMTYIPIANDNRWKERVRECSAVILYHTTLQGRINVANVDGALYDDELRYLINFLGREKVVVLLDDMEDISEEEKRRILGTQIFPDLLSSHLILIPKKNKSEAAKIQLTEFCTTLSKGASTSQQKESSGILPYIYSKLPRWAGGTEHSGSKTNGKGERAPRTSDSIGSKFFASHPPYQIGIFSRSAESNYKWLIDSLKEDDHKKSFDIKAVYITNDYQTFRSGLQTCRFAILYHTKKQGRLNITDVADSLYDEELRDMSQSLGRENVIVVADDLTSGDPEDKERILTHQPSIDTYAEDLFLFTEDEKHTRSLGTMKDIIQRRQVKHNGRGIGNRAGPSRERESSKNNPGYSVARHENRITPVLDSSPSCSGSGNMVNSDIINHGKGEGARNTTNPTFSNPSQSPPPPYRIGIFSRSAESNYTWLIRRLKEDDRMRSLDIKSVYITNDYETFRSGLETCRFAILYHTKRQGRLNITDVADSLYNAELRDMSNVLGRENVIVVADDLMSGDPEDKERILTHQPSIRTYAEDLFLFTEDEKYTRSLGSMKDIIQSSVKRSQQEKFSGGFSSITSTRSGSSGDAEHYDTKNNNKGERRRPPAAGSTSGKSSKPSRSPSLPYRIGIFSRCSEINYKWLSDRLKEEERMGSLDIKTVCITNDEKTFRSGLETCQFGILYHTLKYGRLNITDVTNSLYDDELREMSQSLGKENVIVVADDVRSSAPEEKERILTNQTSIPTYAEDLFVFTEGEKYTRSLEEIRDIIRRSQAKRNNPDTGHQAAPSRGREPSMKAHGYFSDDHANRIKSDHQVSTRNSSPSCSGSVGDRITSQNSDPAEPQPKKPKKLPSEQTNSMEGDFVLLEAPSPDLLSALNKKWNDSQQENREPRKDVHSQEERIKELEKSLNSLTLEKNRAVESMKRIIQREERNIDGHGEEIRERGNLQQQRETEGKEMGGYIIPQEGEGGAHGHETPPLGLGRFPEIGENVLPQEGEGGAHGHETPPLGLGRFPEIGENVLPLEGGGGAHGCKTPPQGRERFPEKEHHLKEHLQKTEGSSRLENQSMDGLLTKIEEIINEKNLKLQGPKKKSS